MLRMDQVTTIRELHFAHNWSVRRLARELKLSRNTIRKYLAEGAPRRNAFKPRARPVREKVEPRIRELCEEWSGRTTAKQRITAERLHRELTRVEKCEVGLTVVRGVLADMKREAAEVYIPLVHRPGEEAQVDFFEVVLDVREERQKAWMFILRLMFSGRDFAWLYERCDQISFLEGHVRAFRHFGGVVWRAVYDNLKPAVQKVVVPRRELTERFQALTSHYLFEPDFARVGEGHDKGGVEARGKGIRLAHLTPIPTGESLEEISQQLVAELDQRAAERVDAGRRTVLEKFEEERRRFRPLPATDFEARRVVPVSISSKATFQCEGAVYSVPEHWARQRATALVGPSNVLVACQGEEVLKRRRGKGERDIEHRHYLRELSRKPHAVRQVARELVEELGEPFKMLWKRLEEVHGPQEAGRILARFLGAIVAHGEVTVRVAVERALEAGRTDLLALSRTLHEPRWTVAVPARLTAVEIEMARASDYDVLLAGGEA